MPIWLFTMERSERSRSPKCAPDDSPGLAPAATLILSAEDNPANTIRPRLDAAGADTTRIFIPKVMQPGEEPRDFELERGDLVGLKYLILRTGTMLVVLDPLVSYVPAEVNVYHDKDVRRALRLVEKVASETGAAVVVVRHLNKNTTASAVNRGGGSIGIIGAARSALVLAADPDDPSSDVRVLASVKSNLARAPLSLKLRLVPNEALGCARVQWEGPSHHTAKSLLELPLQGRRAPVRERAVELLHGALSDGPLPAPEVGRLAREAGISKKTLERAAKELGVLPEKIGQPGTRSQGWIWSLNAEQGCERAGVPKSPSTTRSGDLRVGDSGKALPRNEVVEGSHVVGIDDLHAPAASDLTAFDDEPAALGEGGGGA